MPPLADQIVSDTTLLPWLLKRVGQKEYESNKQYASEILAILLQQSRANVMKLAGLDGMETMLKVLSVSGGFTCMTLLMGSSNIGRRIRGMARRWSSWRISSTACARRSRKRR